MNVKILVLVLGFMSSTIIHAATKNVCDGLIEAGSSEEQIKKCQEKFGVSDYAAEQAAKTNAKVQTENNKKEVEVKNKNNIEEKKFSESDLLDAGFGQPFYAWIIKNKWGVWKEERLTSGEAMCKYLGYEKSVKSMVSPYIEPVEAYKKGLVIDTNFLGVISKEPELWDNKDINYRIRKYVEVTCIRRIDKSVEDSEEQIKKMVEYTLILPPTINGGKKPASSEVNDGSRNTKKGSENGYKKPDWMEDEPAKSVSK